MDESDLDKLFASIEKPTSYRCNFCQSDGYVGRILFKAETAIICAECVGHLALKLHTFAHLLNLEPESNTRH
jgi:hypothetical protein